MKKLLEYLKLTVWTADFAWKAFTYFVVAAGGTTASVLASGLEIFATLGWLALFGIGLLAALMTALIVYLVRAAQRFAAETVLFNALSAKSTQINPLQSSFSDAIIHLSDLHLPGKQIHEHKQFKRCKFVGPGAIAVFGGTLVNNGFYETGHVLTVPESILISGITVLANCTVEDCEFYQTTLIFPRTQVGVLRQIPGIQIAL